MYPRKFLFTSLIFCLISHSCFSQPTIKNLALEGGGIRGIAFAGTIHVLEKEGILKGLEKVAGSSAGAIAGMLIALNYTSHEIDSVLYGIKFQKFNDGGWGLLGKYKRVRKKFGIFKGDAFYKWLQELVEFKTGNSLTDFSQLHNLRISGYKDLYVTGTNISKQELQIFSYEKTPHVPIALSVRISSGIPWYFEPIALYDDFTEKQPGDSARYINYFVDGGMICNYPISMFDSCVDCKNPLIADKLIFNKHTLGLKLERQEQIELYNAGVTTIAKYNPKNFNDYLMAFANLMVEKLARNYPNLENEKGRSIYISDGNFSPRIKKLPKKTKDALYENGVRGAEEYFNY